MTKTEKVVGGDAIFYCLPGVLFGQFKIRLFEHLINIYMTPNSTILFFSEVFESLYLPLKYSYEHRHIPLVVRLNAISL